MGGENWTRAVGFHDAPGPSPRGWGELRWQLGEPVQSRTIPTRVGRTKRHLVCQTRAADHPHAGGENVSLSITLL